MIRPAAVVAIAGPTAAGKSALALAIAERIHGEIVCADSRQVYAGMPIASASPTPEERARVPHHGFGALDPLHDKFTAARFIAFADACVADIRARGHVPLLVGGTGLYLRAWRLGLDEPGAERDMARMLARAPRPIARDVAWLLVDADLAVLEPRIRARAAGMFAHGVVDEARALAARLPTGHALLGTLGIEEALALDARAGPADVDAAVAHTALRTRQYARRQRTWFRKEPWWHRLDPTRATVVEDALSLVAQAG